MRNFYYIQTYNMMHPSIRRMFDLLGVLGIHDSLSELKVRSKHFLGFHEATAHAHEDFNKKLTRIFPLEKDEKSKENAVKIMTVMNPKFAMPDQIAEMIDEKFGEQHGKWDDDCCATMFFCDAPESEEGDESFPKTWMVKYEIFFEDAMMNLVRKNGEYAFDPAALAFQSYTSTLQ